jgi:glycosyltransferase involved in cell wall biosynthesis
MTTVHVVVDALPVHFGGGATYLTNQLQALRRVAPDVQVQLLAGRWNEPLLRESGLPAAQVEVIRVPDGIGRGVWEQVALPGRATPPTVLYAPGGIVPLRPCRVPVLAALQNPNFFGRGRQATHNRRWHRRWRVALHRWSARRADHLITVSESFRREVVGDLPELAGRLSVIPSGIAPLPSEHLPPPTFPPGVDEFVLSLANDAPHKQLDLLCQAWGEAAAVAADVPPLVLAGAIPVARQQHQRSLVPPRCRSSLHHLGPVARREEVAWLLGRARALVSASILETFGFTPAEAGEAGCPVILSDIPAHREVAGEHATYVPAGDRTALRDALADLPAPGTRRPWRWPVSWDDHARALHEVLLRLANRPRHRAST